jgi:pyridinium-3,5-biscarboxylic acid mononucleotide sulfurtransferase
MVIEQKWDRLRTLLRGIKCAVLAYSGGVDSSLLLRATAEVMGHRLIAVTAVSETYPRGELEAAKEFARTLGVTHRILRTQELSSEEFARNSPERCYFCKKELYGKLKKIAETEGISCILDGSNTDDLVDYRPGRKAAEEFSVRSPLVETELSKSDVRELARFLNLPMWDKPSLACLSSRIPYGTRITPDIIETVQTAEDHLRVLGFRQVRVRHHGEIARIEIDREAFGQILTGDVVQKITAALKGLGYIYVCLDLEGYRTGSMNAACDREQRERAESRE